MELVFIFEYRHAMVLQCSVVDLPTLNVLDHVRLPHLFGLLIREIKDGFGSKVREIVIATPVGYQQMVGPQCCVA
ncbi:MAG: hypothetical protein ACKPKO_64550, partial [Candidatus Fonsibacter sp.]